VAVNHLDDEQSLLCFEQMLCTLQYSGVKSEADRLISVPGDIREHETGVRFVQETVERLGHIDILVTNAGICEFADFLS
jgi:L-rhamnose 1-dehydrogenase